MNSTATNGSTIDKNNAPNCIILLATMLSGVELLMHPVAALASLFSFSLLFKTNLLHRNLKCILLAQSMTIAVCELCRIVYVTLKFINGDMFFNGASPVQMTALTSIKFRNLLAYLLIAERAFATVYYRNYENFTKSHFIRASIGCLLVLSIWLALSQLGTPWKVFENTFVVTIIILTSDFGLIVVISLLYYCNRHYYEYGQTLLLNQKFQLSENIRTARQLTPSFCFHFVNICANECVTILVYFKFVERTYMVSVCFLFAAIVNGVASFLIELTVISHHPALKRKALRWLRYPWKAWKLRRNNNRVINIGGTTAASAAVNPLERPHVVAANYVVRRNQNHHHQIHDIRGRNLIPRNSNGGSREQHFRILHDLWN